MMLSDIEYYKIQKGNPRAPGQIWPSEHACMHPPRIVVYCIVTGATMARNSRPQRPPNDLKLVLQDEGCPGSQRGASWLWPILGAHGRYGGLGCLFPA